MQRVYDKLISVLRLLAAAFLLLACARQATAIPGDVNGDGWVAFKDFALVATNWQKTSPAISPSGADLNSDDVVDWKDVAIVADNWLTGTPPNVAPVVTNISAAAVQYLLNPITLAATDDGKPIPPSKLQYIITSLPADGNLYDMAPGGMKITSPRLPYMLVADACQVYYQFAGTSTPATFNFKASDHQYTSDANATATVTRTAYVKDNVSFDGEGFITVADNAYLDGTTFAISFWLRTREPNGGILCKRETNGKGVEVALIGGRISLKVWDASGSMLVGWCGPTFAGNRLDNGQWHVVTVGLNSTSIYIFTDYIGAYWVDYTTTGFTMDNTAAMLIGTDGSLGFKGSIDRLITWKNPTAAIWDISQINAVARTATTYGSAPACTLDWRFAEGAGTTVTDSKASLTGTFNDAAHVTWYPQGEPLPVLIPGGR